METKWYNFMFVDKFYYSTQTVLTILGIILITMGLFILPAKDSVVNHEKGEVNISSITALYDPHHDRIYLNKNNTLIRINDTYVGKNYFEKEAIAHEVCHRNQMKQNRLYYLPNASTTGLFFNELECYFKGYLLIKL